MTTENSKPAISSASSSSGGLDLSALGVPNAFTSRVKKLNWVVVALFFYMLILACVNIFTIFRNTGAGGFFVGGLMALLPLTIYIPLTLWLDRFEAEPVWMLVMSFLWGCTVAVFCAFIFNGIAATIAFAVTRHEGATNYLGATFGGPFVEEIAKGMLLYVFFLWRRDEFDGPVDGIVYGLLVGLGFALAENTLYYGNAFKSGQGLWDQFLIRSILKGMAGHPLYTALTGLGLGIARKAKDNGAKFIASVGGLAAGILLHFAWNASTSDQWLIYWLLLLPGFLAILMVVLYSLGMEGKMIRERLAPDVAAGVLTADEVACLCSVPARIKATIAAVQGGGPKRWWTRRQFHACASELAFHRVRAERGVFTPDVAAEREKAYIARLQEIKARLNQGA